VFSVPSVVKNLTEAGWNFKAMIFVINYRRGPCNKLQKRSVMAAFFLWCILFLICWPLALLALILYPLVWLFLLPFRLVGIAVEGALKLVWAVVTLPARLLAAPFRV
jgi:hypothetical protein